MTRLERFADDARFRDPSECWDWTGPIGANGYGVHAFQRNGRYTSTSAHRAVWEALVGPIPAGLQIDHLCRRTTCCNPAHLEPVPPKVNVARSGGVAAINSAKTHCPLGHELRGDNLLESAGRRICRACKRATGRRTKARRKGQLA